MTVITVHNLSYDQDYDLYIEDLEDKIFNNDLYVSYLYNLSNKQDGKHKYILIDEITFFNATYKIYYKICENKFYMMDIREFDSTVIVDDEEYTRFTKI